MRKFLITGIFLLAILSLHAQQAGLDKTVSLNYQRVPLERALQDISEDYAVFFSYSKDIVPVREKVSVSVYNQPLRLALDKLLSSTKIVYAPIGEQIVLRVEEDKIVIPLEEELTSSIKEIPVSPPAKTYTTTLPKLNMEKRDIPVRPTPLLRSPDLEPLDWTEEMTVLDEEAYTVIPYEGAVGRNPYHRLAQVSVFPEIGTNLGKSEDITNNVSVNVLWGKNGGVDGLEIGGLVNSIEGDVHGVQIAGLANLAKGELNGTSVIKTHQKAKAGLQISGITNVAGAARGAQITGGINRVSDGDLNGAQFAGLANTVNGNASGWQFAGLFNNNQGDAGLQIAGLLNHAKQVNKGQIALINQAHKVNGLQIGLINIADSIQGTPIGLLNFIRYGFNHIEVASTETFDLALGLKFGAPSFYNMLEVSSPRLKGSRTIFASAPHWALGYGIGTTLHYKKRINYQLEALVHQVNEGETWSSDLNLLSQLRLIANIRFSKRFSLFAGPTINIFISSKYDADNETFTSDIFQEENSSIDEMIPGIKPHQIQTWVGYKFGVRF